MTTPVSKYRVWCITESLHVHAWSLATPTSCPNDGGHSIDTAKTAVVQTRERINLIVDPVVEPVVPGASQVVANGRPAIEVQSGVTGYSAIQCVWPHEQNELAHIDIVVSFILKSLGTGATVRVIARINGHGEGDDSSSGWVSTHAVDKTVSHATLGEVFRVALSLDADDFDLEDAIVLQIGRDGSHANDTCSEAIQIIGIKAEAH